VLLKQKKSALNKYNDGHKSCSFSRDLTATANSSTAQLLSCLYSKHYLFHILVLGL